MLPFPIAFDCPAMTNTLSGARKSGTGDQVGTKVGTSDGWMIEGLSVAVTVLSCDGLIEECSEFGEFDGCCNCVLLRFRFPIRFACGCCASELSLSRSVNDEGEVTPKDEYSSNSTNLFGERGDGYGLW